MWNKPSKEELAALPPLYTFQDTPLPNVPIGMHFFLGGSDWYAAEYSPEENIFWGFAIINNDLQNAEWGYYSLEELAAINVKGFLEIDRDLHWKTIEAGKIPKIVKAQGWK